MSRKIFGSDNAAGVAQQILEAMIEVNQGHDTAYGDDALSQRLDVAFSEFFEHETFVFPAGTGTAANALGLAGLTPGYGEIYCHENAHILTTECGAPEFFCNGARLVPLPGLHGKIEVSALEETLCEHVRPNRHHMKPSVLSLSQATEAGTLYSPDELVRLTGLAREYEVRIHLDGARLANAQVSLGLSAADLTWRIGVDAVSLGTTKNGTMNAEAVVVFDADLARHVAYLHKRAGLLTSKMRFVSAQLLAYLRDDLWRKNAERANAVALKIARGLQGGDNRILHPVETNQIFVELGGTTERKLARAGLSLRKWPGTSDNLHRIVTSFQATDKEVDDVCRALEIV